MDLDVILKDTGRISFNEISLKIPSSLDPHWVYCGPQKFHPHCSLILSVFPPVDPVQRILGCNGKAERIFLTCLESQGCQVTVLIIHNRLGRINEMEEELEERRENKVRRGSDETDVKKKRITCRSKVF